MARRKTAHHATLPLGPGPSTLDSRLSTLVIVVDAALNFDCPARKEHGIGKRGFAGRTVREDGYVADFLDFGIFHKTLLLDVFSIL